MGDSAATTYVERALSAARERLESDEFDHPNARYEVGKTLLVLKLGGTIVTNAPELYDAENGAESVLSVQLTADNTASVAALTRALLAPLVKVVFCGDGIYDACFAAAPPWLVRDAGSNDHAVQQCLDAVLCGTEAMV